MQMPFVWLSRLAYFLSFSLICPPFKHKLMLATVESMLDIRIPFELNGIETE